MGGAEGGVPRLAAGDIEDPDDIRSVLGHEAEALLALAQLLYGCFARTHLELHPPIEARQKAGDDDRGGTDGQHYAQADQPLAPFLLEGKAWITAVEESIE